MCPSYPHARRAFIGQSGGKSAVGMKQAEQKKVLADFRAGKFNTLVATCIAEEGLDIAEASDTAVQTLHHRVGTPHMTITRPITRPERSITSITSF